MPEYLAPGVYVEEVSFRSKSIEGVPTSTTGFAGMTRHGPVQYPGGPTTTQPRLITSFTEFERVYGGLESLGTGQRVNYLAHAARAYFLNGGKRLYVSRVIAGDGSATAAVGAARPVGAGTARWRARWPGAFGNVQVETRLIRTQNVNFTFPASDPVRSTWGPQARGAKAGTIVEITPAGGGLATVLSRVEPFEMEDGQTLAVSIDGAADVSVPFNGSQASKSGAGAFAAMADGLTLVVQIDTLPQQTFTFQATDNTAELVAARINETLIGGAATAGGGSVQITSDTSGLASRVEVLGSSTALAETGFDTNPAGGGGNVQNIRAVTADEVVAALTGTLTGVVVANENGAVRITSQSAGAGSGVIVRPGAGASALRFVSPATNSGSAVSGDGPFNLEPGQSLVVAIDSGVDQAFVFEGTWAEKSGSGGAFATMTDGLTLVIQIDGGPSQTVVFAATDTTADLVAARINSVLIGGAALVTGAGQVNVRSDRRGAGSRVEVLTASTAQTETGQSAGAGVGTGGTRATKFGVGATYAATIAGRTLDISIDGGAPQTVALQAADTTAAAVAARINAVLVGGTATEAGGQVNLASSSVGAGSRVEVLGTSTAQVETGQAAGSVAGGDIANIDAVTAEEVVEAVQSIAGGTASIEGDAVRITSGSTGATSTVQIQAASTATALGFDNMVHGPGGSVPTGNDIPNMSQLFVVETGADGRQRFVNRANPSPGVSPAMDDTISIVTLRVIVTVDRERVDVYDALGAGADDKRYAGRILEAEDPEDENAVVWLDVDDTAAGESAELLLAALRGTGPTGQSEILSGGTDGNTISPDDLLGAEADPDDPDLKATGLEALGEIEDIAIVAAPDAATLSDPVVAAGYVIAHAEKERYRIAVVDGPANSSMTEIREFRGQFDSKYAALYYPWIQVLDPTERAAQGAPPRKLLLPASGFVSGIYARSDIERGVHKAPANEIVRGLTQFEMNINKPRQDVLNPEGINALRFFPGRGNRVWGARTMSSDPEWKYVNVRRLFIYLEHSIDKGTQWAVFEPNNRRLWDNIRQTVEDFLLVLWRDGALLGDKPEDAYFVRCDRTTMTQNDLDNGRLICLIGVAPVKPAEFVIFRVGQWTADSKV